MATYAHLKCMNHMLLQHIRIIEQELKEKKASRERYKADALRFRDFMEKHTDKACIRNNFYECENCGYLRELDKFYEDSDDVGQNENEVALASGVGYEKWCWDCCFKEARCCNGCDEIFEIGHEYAPIYLESYDLPLCGDCFDDAVHESYDECMKELIKNKQTKTKEEIQKIITEIEKIAAPWKKDEDYASDEF